MTNGKGKEETQEIKGREQMSQTAPYTLLWWFGVTVGDD